MRTGSVKGRLGSRFHSLTLFQMASRPLGATNSVNSFVGLLAHWMVGQLDGWLIDRLVSWPVGCLVPAGWLANLPVALLIE